MPAGTRSTQSGGGVTAQASTPAAGDIHVHMTIDHPEIVMVEDAMDLNTNALIMDVSPMLCFLLAPCQ